MDVRSASVRVARGLESVLGVGSEFVVFVLSVVRHVDINLARFATRGVVSLARTSGRPAAGEVGQGRRVGDRRFLPSFVIVRASPSTYSVVQDYASYTSCP